MPNAPRPTPHRPPGSTPPLPPQAASERATRLAWPALAIWIALGLVVLRVLVRLAVGHERGWSLGTASWDLGQDLAGILSGAVAAALAATVPGRRKPRVLWFALATALVAYVLVGTHLERPPARFASPFASTWPFAAGLLAVGAAIAAYLRWLAERPRPLLAPLGGARGILLPAAVACVATIGFAAATVLRPPQRDVAWLVREFFDSSEQTRWDVRRTGAAAPHVDTLGPVLQAHVGRPTIVMPPPCELALAIRDQDGIARLAGGVCVDVRFARRHADDEPWSVTFELEKNGARLFARTISLGRGQAPPEDWISIASDLPPASPERAFGDGLLVRGGDEIVLRTSASANAPPEFTGAAGTAAGPGFGVGFGGLVLERLGRQPARPASPRHPNIVLVVMDTQRADRLGCYGYDRGTSPHLDALAARGLVFDAAYATSSWTWPATASILTGRWPAEHGVTSNASCYLWGSERTLAEVLREQGFRTAAFSGNNLIVASQNFDQGFDHFDGSSEFRKSDALMPAALAWIERHAAERFFLYLQLVDPHEPHRPLPELAERFDVADLPPGLPAGPPRPGREPDPREEAFNVYTHRLLQSEHYDANGVLEPEHAVPPAHQAFLQRSYDAAVATGDHWFGRLLAKLERLGLDQQTVVVFTSDHGRLAHGHTVHEELVRVPLVIAGPGVPVGVREALPVSNKELFGTLARLADANLTEPGFDLLRREFPGYRRVLFSTEKGWWNGRKNLAIHGLRSDLWALHAAPLGLPWSQLGASVDELPDSRFGERRLYAKDVDPYEHVDLAGEQPEVADALSTELGELLRRALERAPSGALGAGEAMEQNLHELGYFGRSEED